MPRVNTEYEDGMETDITVRVGPGWINWINAAVYCAEGEGGSTKRHAKT